MLLPLPVEMSIPDPGPLKKEPKVLLWWTDRSSPRKADVESERSKEKGAE
jgi:hypothetical protein